MFLVIVLQQLAHLTKELVARSTVIGIVRSGAIVITTIGQPGCVPGQVGRHPRLRIGKSVDLISSVVGAPAPSAIATLHVLDGIGSRSEAAIATNGTGNIFRAVDLAVHVQFILCIERPVALFTLKGDCSRRIAVDAIVASRHSDALAPLVATEIIFGTPIFTTFRAFASHTDTILCIIYIFMWQYSLRTCIIVDP